MVISLVRALMAASVASVTGASLAYGGAPVLPPVPGPNPPLSTEAAPPAQPTAGQAAGPTAGPSPAPTPVAGFAGTVGPVAASRLHASWRPGCPVGPDQLRLVTISHFGFDGAVQRGEVVVHADTADDVLATFARLYELRFPIEQARLVDDFGGDDDTSMAANNTSAFNCRKVAGTGRWSQHAYGRAIDINPVQNPYVTRSGPKPPASAPYADRSNQRSGMVTPEVIDAFATAGWSWGGRWSRPDYQHFSATGR